MLSSDKRSKKRKSRSKISKIRKAKSCSSERNKSCNLTKPLGMQAGNCIPPWHHIAFPHSSKCDLNAHPKPDITPVPYSTNLQNFVPEFEKCQPKKLDEQKLPRNNSNHLRKAYGVSSLKRRFLLFLFLWRDQEEGPGCHTTRAKISPAKALTRLSKITCQGQVQIQWWKQQRPRDCS